MNYSWLLPEYIEDILPDDAWRVESLRRGLLDFERSTMTALQGKNVVLIVSGGIAAYKSVEV